MNMAYQHMFPCYVCNLRLPLQRLMRIDGEYDALTREVAISRRDARELPPMQITGRTRLCLNRRRAISAEIEAIRADPTCARFIILSQRSSHLCFICNSPNNLKN